jgi:hypothetical protein
LESFSTGCTVGGRYVEPFTVFLSTRQERVALIKHNYTKRRLSGMVGIIADYAKLRLKNLNVSLTTLYRYVKSK